MKVLKVVFFSLCFSSTLYERAYSQLTYYQVISEAHGYFYTEEYSKSLKKFTIAFDIDKPKSRDLIIASYSAAMVDNDSAALYFLKQYFQQNSTVYLDIESIISAPAFNKLKGTSEFKNITNTAYKNNSELEPQLNNKLRIELEKLYDQDQQTRDMEIMDSLVEKHGFPSEPVSAYFKKMNAHDKKNLNRFRELVPVGTWPGISEVGTKANLAAWLIIQHCATPIQKQYLEDLKQSAKAGESNWQQVAGTIDRIMEEEEGVQLYGTQFGMNADGTGFVKPIKDAHNVNKRREEVGLIALEHDVKRHGVELNNP